MLDGTGYVLEWSGCGRGRGTHFVETAAAFAGFLGRETAEALVFCFCVAALGMTEGCLFYGQHPCADLGIGGECTLSTEVGHGVGIGRHLLEIRVMTVEERICSRRTDTIAQGVENN
jgi:hypothetical protein